MDESHWKRALRETTGRREFLALSGSLAASLALRGLPARRADARPRLRQYPFTLGVASGDPTPDGVVLWTRLASAADAGMPDRRIAVDWEVSEDDGFGRIVRRGSTVATPDLGHSVHADVRGLAPGRPYWYRFLAGGEASPVGRTWTAPPPDSLDPLRFVFCSCQHFEQGLYTALGHMADEDARVVFHLGDYIYENGPAPNALRAHSGPEIMSLEDYRARYAQYKSDEHLRAAHAALPFIVTWDDHEVDNNYAGVHHEAGMSVEAFLRRRAAAYQAYWEHQPLRPDLRPRGPDLRLYRRFRFGRLASFHVLDTRQYRTDQPCGDDWAADCPGARDPEATMLGAEQRSWLLDGLGGETRWDVLAHQVPIAPAGRIREGVLEQSMDKWAGYLADRDRLMAALAERARNPVSIVGDVHVNWLADLKRTWYDDGPAIGTEFVGTSLSSGGDGRDGSVTQMHAANPHVHFFNGQRGYVRCEITKDRWTADYRVVEYVSRPGAPISTRASFVVEDGHPGGQPA